MSTLGDESDVEHRQRVKARVAETSLLMDALEKQKQKLEAQLKADSASVAAAPRSDVTTLDSLGLQETALSAEAVGAVGMGIEVAEITEGMSDELRRQVEVAIADLGLLGQQCQEEQELSEHAGNHEEVGRNSNKPGVKRGYTPSHRELQLEQQVWELKKKIEMSRSIMRKLHLSNVELEKEVKVMAATGQPSAHSPSTVYNARDAQGYDAPAGTAALRDSSHQTPTVAMLQERERTVHELSAALDSSRRRAAALEQSLLQQKGGGESGATHKAHPNNSAVTDVLAQSAVHFQQYRDIRSNYNKLLTRRTQALSRASGVSSEAKSVVSELQARLSKEMEEREVESAMYNARLYENEKQQGDWYVERRMLEKRIIEQDEELKKRDKMDVEIEQCVCDLFNQISTLERDNQLLREQFLKEKEAPVKGAP
eukprot:CAMPEP_0177753472 /NCGR_PEP_ID=MMETSP0491_2-20121128/1479_1 /TAXON_ID=63592 /ORGANISM="Tetraselmis chuii, Strain PLY429" /LENGTH=426 /DNA_ID=CAMNT_0019268761 /DNA_START=36 /DNA_END=1316 /DNA_ORIENTATION=+